MPLCDNALIFIPSECVHLLLNHGAPVKVKNNAGWSPLSEAISYGDRQTCKIINLCTESKLIKKSIFSVLVAAEVEAAVEGTGGRAAAESGGRSAQHR
jgi:ankyrin repeat protein